MVTIMRSANSNMKGERSSPKIELLRPSFTTYAGTAAGLTSAGEFPGEEEISEAAQIGFKGKGIGTPMYYVRTKKQSNIP